jgi:hypothetical protein
VYSEYHSGRPYTRYPTATGFEPVVQNLFAQNNARMPRYVNLDLKATQRFKFHWLPSAVVALYLDMRNVFNEANVKWIDSNGRIGGELFDLGGYFVGRRTTLGLLVEM